MIVADRRTLSAMFVFGAKLAAICKHCKAKKKMYCKLLCRPCYNFHGDKYPTVYEINNKEFLELLDKVLLLRAKRKSYAYIAYNLDLDIKMVYRIMCKARKLELIPMARGNNNES